MSAAPSKKLSNIHAIMTQICFQYGAAFGRLSKGLTFMILKIDVVIRTYKLRDIILFEADFNFANNLYFWNKLMKIEESSGVLPQEQHFIRSGHTSIEVAVTRSLFFDYAIRKRRNFTLGFYYGEKCYDRVAHNFSLLADKDFNMPLPEIIICLKSIQDIKLYVRTDLVIPEYHTMG